MDDIAASAAERERMVVDQLIGRDIRDQRVLAAMRTVPRHAFVPGDYRHLAYSDGPLPIGEGQTISQPYIVALMTQLLSLEGHEKVLEVGTGSGYQAAILAYLVAEVHTIERHAQLADNARALLTDLGYKNVHIHLGDGSQGWFAAAPYDAVIVTAAAPEVSPLLLEQLAEGGRLVIPVGGRFNQLLQLWRRKDDAFTHDELTPVAFVPLMGKYGWDKKRWGIF
jgi:protein-L-isoaspartate(D-aspartate) O-methyltransferase